MKYNPNIHFNRLVYIHSTEDDTDNDEIGPTGRLIESLAPLADREGVDFSQHRVRNAAELNAVLSSYAKRDEFPIIHLDMHGNAEKGLQLADGRYFSWKMLASKLRGINRYTRNNLAVIMSCCYSLHFALELRHLDQAVPFFVLAAPENEISIGELEAGIVPFYRAVFSSENFGNALREHLPSMQEILSEKMFLTAMLDYELKYCSRKAIDTRTEAVMSRAKSGGIVALNGSLRSLRRATKSQLRKGLTRAYFDRHVDVYMIGRRPAFDYQEFKRLSAARKSSAAPKRKEFRAPGP